MESKPVSSQVAPEPHRAPQPAEAVRPDASVRAVAQDDQADLRLVIEQDPSGVYVYKTVDRRTGDVVRQLPRDEILHMREAEGYAIGDVVSAKA